MTYIRNTGTDSSVHTAYTGRLQRIGRGNVATQNTQFQYAASVEREY